ncbi:uncharacterized protein LAESUDRAFT_738494 [Laetiporus sulphureus 93-53]|uniref:Zinc finger Mcm10/DnaG-type domain-containing protein n=1 Tax=Laetiporus sulphureus 93-53 TaxID=1314785 RepID=A0A165CGW3_9APHY|nr:uncharacterized protein LAESUDRAFT_738494 [Laetiporus sulphureus 93-53]KZT02785.1 hypothetical protein LAESUDRAFT_738494 [Laetiporus sulphureus 93-53]
MESISSRKDLEQQQQAEIHKQIAILQAQLTKSSTSYPTRTPPERKERPESDVLVPASPSPKRKKSSHRTSYGERGSMSVRSMSQQSRSSQTLSSSQSSVARNATAPAQKQVPSTVLQKLAKAHSRKDTQLTPAAITRSTAFTEKPAPQDDTVPQSNAQQRDDRLALVEKLIPGPVEHKPPFDDPKFEKLEPCSGIRLSSRSISHEDFQDYLRGRYYLSPSKLYSVVRLLPDKQGYDVPVCGDWLTIAVVAERGQIKHTQAPVGIGREDKLEDEEAQDSVDNLLLNTDRTKQPRAGKSKQEPPRASGKKYVNLKLVDFGCRESASSESASKAIRGDAMLSLLLFESDSYDVITMKDGRKEKVYKGGSKGAFEKMSTLREGAVVALLNPRILKPFQRSSDAPHPTDNILALTPESIFSVAVIGYSQDLGMCTAIKRDGKPCGSWCDRRIADICEYHIQHAVERKRAARPEFSNGTSGMSTGAKRSKPAYDPARQWGLKPPDNDGATYVVSGHIVSGANDAKSLFISESLGRDAQAKASRRGSAKAADEALQKLLKRDREGTKALVTAREFGKRASKEEKGKAVPGKRKREIDENESGTTGMDGERGSADEEEPRKKRKTAYSAQMIKRLGFDPTAKDGRRAADDEVQSKLAVLAALQTSRRQIHLGPHPGKKNSCVQRPASSVHKSEPKVQERKVLGKVLDSSPAFVDLDSSDAEL